MSTLPQDSKWIASQLGERFGSIVRSKNLSLDDLGIARLAKKAMVLLSKDDDNGFGFPLAIETDGSVAYILTDTQLFRILLTLNSLPFDEDTAPNRPALGVDSDMVIYNDTIHATGGTILNYLNALGMGQLWNDGTKPATDLDDTVPHPLCVFENRNTLLVGDGNTVRQYDSTYARQTGNELILPPEFIVTSIRYMGSRAYVGTRHRYGGQARLFVWTGTGASANGGGWPCGADWIYSQCEYKSSIVVVTSAGQIRRFNAGGFDDLAEFPVYYTPYSWVSNADNSSLIGKVASRGMRAHGDVLYINIDGSLSNSSLVYPGTYIPDQPSGLWCFDPNAGLYHKSGYNAYTKLELDVEEVNSSYLVFSTPHQAQTGDAFLSLGGGIGLTSGQVYYAIVDADPLTLRAALSPQDAIAGRAVAASGVPTPGTDRCFFDRYESMGQTSISRPGGLAVFGRNLPNPFFGSEVIFGGETIDSAETVKGVAMSLGMGRNAGSFVTPRIPATEAIDTYNKLLTFFETLGLPTDAIVLKFRKMKRLGLPTPLFFTGSADFTSSTTFTVDTTEKSMGGVEIGDEIEIVEGAAAGYTAHITDINRDSSTYVVTIDETMPVSSGKFDFVADNWKKLGSTITKDIPTALDAGYADRAVDTTAHWVQFKVELRGVGTGLEQMRSDNTGNSGS